MSLINTIKPSDILGIDPKNYEGENKAITMREFHHIMRVLNAYWQHDGTADAPHVRLSSGLHSSLFLNVALALTYPPLTDIFAYAIVNLVRKHYKGPIDWVIGSDHSGANLAYAVARLLKARSDFTEKRVETVNGEQMKFQDWKRFPIGEKERVLLVEELTTTAGTIMQMMEGITNGTPHRVQFVPIIAAIVNRTGVPRLSVNRKEVHGLFTYPPNQWTPDECPLCRIGSEVIDKPRHEWKRLMAHCAAD